MWIYHQKDGKLYHNNALLGTGYAGAGYGKNNPACQNEKDIGPLPCGIYTISPAFTDPEKGPLSMHLFPHATNCMFGRGGFFIHGDSLRDPGMASEGCIVLSHPLRTQISLSHDNELLVVTG